MNDEVSKDLSAEDAAGMTVNERLYVSRLMSHYDEAVVSKDINELTKILRQIHLDEKSIEAIFDLHFGEK